MRYRSFKRKLAWLLLTMLFASAAISFGVLYYFHLQELHFHDEHFAITAIRQVGPERGKLKTAYLANLLDLALDKKVSLIGYQTEEAERKLLCSPVIRKVKVSKIKPNILAVEFALRKPIFRLINYENSAIDDEGVVIPLVPFFNEKGLPELRIENKQQPIKILSWGDKLPAHVLRFTLDFVDVLRDMEERDELFLKRLDLENLHASTLGKRAIRVIFVDSRADREWNIVLSPKTIPLQLARFVLFRDYFLKNSPNEFPLLIDFRVPALAFAQF